MDYLPHITLDTGENPTASVIWLHGLGATGHDFEPMVPYLQLPKDLPVRFIFPHAPEIPVTINGGYMMPAWYDILEMALERKIDETQIQASSDAIAALIDREIARGIRSERIIIAGFSQGGAVAYHCALSYPKPLGGLLALSTYFATHNTLTINPANQTLPIYIFHGTGDNVVQEVLGKEACERLQKQGLTPIYQTYPMEHEVCMEELTDIANAMQAILNKVAS